MKYILWASQFSDQTLCDGVMLQTFHVHLPTLGDSVPQRVFTIWGVDDDMQVSSATSEANVMLTTCCYL